MVWADRIGKDCLRRRRAREHGADHIYHNGLVAEVD